MEEGGDGPEGGAPPGTPLLPPELWEAILIEHGPLGFCDAVGASKRLVAARRIQRAARSLSRVLLGDDLVHGTPVTVAFRDPRRPLEWNAGILHHYMEGLWGVKLVERRNSVFVFLPSHRVRLRRRQLLASDGATTRR